MNEVGSNSYEAANHSRYFRDVLGNVPTAVVAVTALDETGRPTGMTVGSFTSVSLNPPLVAFLPDKTSTTFPTIQKAGRFCANILTANQEDVCRNLAIKGGDKFARLKWQESAFGTPHIQGAIGWIDCTIDDIHDAGDHLIVVGAVESLRADHHDSPLIFLRGGYGRFASTSLSAPAEVDLYHPLRVVDQALPAMQSVANDLELECLASTAIGDQLVLIGSSMPRGMGDAPFHLRLGQRMRHRPPLATALVAWGSEDSIARWIDSADDSKDPDQLRAMVDRVRDRGWSLVLRNHEQSRMDRAVAELQVRGATQEQVREVTEAAEALRLDTYEPAVIDPKADYSPSIMSAPVFEATGEVTVILSLYQLPRQLSGEEVLRYAEKLVAAANEVSELLRR